MTTKPTSTSKSTIQPPTLESLIAMTNDPADAMRLAADMFAITAHRAERVTKSAAGLPTPRAPKPRSKYMRLFLAGVSAKLGAIAGLLSSDELERLKKIASAIVRRLECNDSDLVEEVLKLLCMEPENAAEWTREHLDEIEARFAS